MTNLIFSVVMLGKPQFVAIRAERDGHKRFFFGDPATIGPDVPDDIRQQYSDVYKYFPKSNPKQEK